MTNTVLKDGRVLHIPGTPFITDSVSVIAAPADDQLADLARLVRSDDLVPFSSRLIRGVKKRRFQPRYAAVNRARLELARLCIDRSLAECVTDGSAPLPQA